MGKDFMSLRELSEQIGIDRSNLRRFAIARGYAWHQRCLPTASGWHRSNCLHMDEARQIIEMLRRDPNVILPPRRLPKGQ
jgi:hypothetical protein